MNYMRMCHTATNLMNGYILITGGKSINDVVLNSAELYCIETGEFSFTSPMIYERDFHVAINLMDRVLIIGGRGEDYEFLNSCEIYNIYTKEFYRVDDMVERRYCPCVTNLENMNLLITGGTNQIMSWSVSTFMLKHSPLIVDLSHNSMEIGLNTCELYEI